VDKFEENSPEMYESLTDFQKFAGAVYLLREGEREKFIYHVRTQQIHIQVRQWYRLPERNKHHSWPPMIIEKNIH